MTSTEEPDVVAAIMTQLTQGWLREWGDKPTKLHPDEAAAFPETFKWSF
jgi:hypothetical protein